MPRIHPYALSLASILLLPLLYSLHQAQRFYPFLGMRDIGLFLSINWLLAAVSWSLWWLLTRDRAKADWLNLLWLSLVCFFSPVLDWLKNSLGNAFLVRYQFLLPALFILSLFMIWKVMRTRRAFVKRTEFLVLVFLIFMFLDLARVAQKAWRPLSSGTVWLKDADPLVGQQVSIKSLPDIYFLVFDELASSQALHEAFGYRNQALDSFLVSKGFLVAPESRSNYHWTQFSLASILNLSYLNVPRGNALEFDDYVAAMNLIRHNRLTPWLQAQGYSIRNCAAFELEGYPARVQYMSNNFRISQLNKDLLWNRINQDIGWHFRNNRPQAVDTAAMHQEMEFSLFNQQKTFDLVKSTIIHRQYQAQFVYGHFFIPHAPFLQDSLGSRRSARDVMIDETNDPQYIQAYLGYLGPTRTKIMQLVSLIQEQAARPTVIIIMGDHGFRHGSQQEVNPLVFRNFFAIQLPAGIDPRPYEKFSGVNLFRQLIPDLMGSSVSLLPDSLFFLRDRK